MFSGVRLWILLALIAGAVLMALQQPHDVQSLLDFGERLADRPGYLIGVAVLMAVLTTFGMPGSLCLWLVAPFQEPLIATIVLVAGSVGGAFGAYLVGAHLRGGWQPAGFSGRVVDLLRHRGDAVTQTALRMLPGFPHAAINFAGGLLPLPLPGFLAAAVVGLSIKWGLYATATQGVVDALESGDALQLETLLPLLLLTVLLLAGNWAARRVSRRRAGG